jgi:hypothetical protein
VKGRIVRCKGREAKTLESIKNTVISPSIIRKANKVREGRVAIEKSINEREVLNRAMNRTVKGEQRRIAGEDVIRRNLVIPGHSSGLEESFLVSGIPSKRVIGGRGPNRFEVSSEIREIS